MEQLNQPTSPPTFLTLPVEIRLMIYDYLVPIHTVHHRIPATEIPKSLLEDCDLTVKKNKEQNTAKLVAVVRSMPIINMLRTCHQVRLEALDKLEKVNKQGELLTSFHCEPARLLLEVPEVPPNCTPEEYKAWTRVYSLNAADSVFLHYLNYKNLRDDHFPHFKRHPGLHTWIERAKRLHRCFQDVDMHHSHLMCSCKHDHAKYLAEPIVQIRTLARDETTGKIDRDDVGHGRWNNYFHLLALGSQPDVSRWRVTEAYGLLHSLANSQGWFTGDGDIEGIYANTHDVRIRRNHPQECREDMRHIWIMADGISEEEWATQWEDSTWKEREAVMNREDDRG